MKLMAIDPGLKGGLAIFDDGQLVDVRRMPIWKASLSLSGKPRWQVDVLALKRILMNDGITQVVTEYQTAMPGQSSKATATSFLNWGLVLSVRSLAELHVVHPRKWKGFYGLGSDKHEAIGKACLVLGPPLTLESTDGEAEAALIGHYWITGGSERERAYTEKQRTRPKRRKRKAANSRQKRPAPALRKRRPRPAPPAPTAASSSPART